MVYQIYYGDSRPRQVLFDIEFYSALDETVKEKKPDWHDEKKWYVELHSISFISGAINFIAIKAINYTADKLKGVPSFDWDEFKKDCEELEELRGWLWESHDNRRRTIKEVNRDMEEWGKYIKEKIYAFADKYGLHVNED